MATGATSGIGWATTYSLAVRGAVVGLLGQRRKKAEELPALLRETKGKGIPLHLLRGVIGLVRTMALEFGPQRVRSNVICPGMVETPMSDEAVASYPEAERAFYRSNLPLGRFGKPHEVAKAVLHLSSADASHSNGMVYSIDGGTTAGYFFAN
ncbi:MAG TPA: SDR family oxidoreductase [Steroidobacteraceae bacterium]|nr:SDR family oxidoreductase [Steroidobacteraceae bacterium]